MKLELRTRQLLLTPELESLVSRRMRFALGRFSERIRRVSIFLADVNGPRGGKGNHCRVVIDAGLSGKVLLEQRGADIAEAVSSLAERASRTMERQLGRLPQDRRRLSR